MLLEERQYAFIEHVCRRDCMLPIVQFDECHLGVRIDEGLLIDSANAFERANVVGALCAQIARVHGINLAVRVFFPLRLLRCAHLVFSQNQAFLGDFGRIRAGQRLRYGAGGCEYAVLGNLQVQLTICLRSYSS